MRVGITTGRRVIGVKKTHNLRIMCCIYTRIYLHDRSGCLQRPSLTVPWLTRTAWRWESNDLDIDDAGHWLASSRGQRFQHPSGATPPGLRRKPADRRQAACRPWGRARCAVMGMVESAAPRADNAWAATSDAGAGISFGGRPFVVRNNGLPSPCSVRWPARAARGRLPVRIACRSRSKTECWRV